MTNQTDYCPLCGYVLPLPSTTDHVQHCELCNAQKYYLLGIPIGYLYPEEHAQFEKLRKYVAAAIGLLFIVLIIAYWFWILPLYPK